MRVEGRTCPHCGGDAAGACGFNGDDVETPGAIVVCLHCTELSRMEPGGSLGSLSPAEALFAAVHPQVQRARAVARGARYGLLHPETN